MLISGLFFLKNRNGIAFVRLDDPTSKVNTLSAGMTSDLRNALENIEKDSAVRAAVLISAKPDCFIAGADINMLSACQTNEELSKLSRSLVFFFVRILQF